MTTTYPTNEAPARRLFNRTCKGCAECFQSVRVEAEFCSDQCRKCWHNLAMVRGRDLYPLVMAWRDRSRANAEESRQALSAICRLVRTYHEEDRRERGGRKSYDTVADVKSRLAHIFNAVSCGFIRAGR